MNSSIETFSRFAKASTKPLTRLQKKDNKIAVAFSRVSSSRQEDGASLEVQKKGIDTFCDREGIIIEKWFGGKSESAKNTTGKEFNEMLTYVKRNHRRIYSIVVYTLDRFSRTGATAITIINELREKYGILVLSATESNVDSLDLPDYEKERELLASNHENRKRAFKSMGGMKDLIEKGYWIHHTPLGYTNMRPGRNVKKHQLVINEKGKLLKKAFKMKATGMYTDVEISMKLEALGLKLNPKRLGEIFRNPFYCGLIASSILPGQVFKGHHPPLVSEEMFLQIHGIIKEKSYGRDQPRQRDIVGVPLKGFMKSAETGRALTGYLSKENNKYYYKSPAKGDNISQRAENLHNLFLDHLGVYQLETDHIPKLKEAFGVIFEEHNQEATADLNLLKQNRGTILARLSTLRERFAIGEIDRDMFTEFSAKYNRELKEVERQIFQIETLDSSKFEKALKSLINLALNPRQYWKNGTYEDRQRLQYLVFPDGMLYSKKNGVVLSPRVNSAFAAISLLKGDSEGGAEKNETAGSEKSGSAMLSGVET